MGGVKVLQREWWRVLQGGWRVLKELVESFEGRSGEF